MDKDAEFTKQLGQVRPTTRNLVEAVMRDAWPSDAAEIDFGIDSQKHYEALYFPIREGEILPKALDEALGHGEKLTGLVRDAASNPHKDVEFHTALDLIFGRGSSMAAGCFSRLDAADFWWCQGLTPPWVAQDQESRQKRESRFEGIGNSADGRPRPEGALAEVEQFNRILDDKSAPQPTQDKAKDRGIER